MSLAEAARALRERWVVVVATILLALAAGSALYALRPATYTATLTVYAAPRPTDPATTTPEASYQGSLLAKERVPSYLQLVVSPQVLSQVIARSRLDATVSELTARVTPTSAPDSVLIDIAVQAPSAEQAVGIAESMSQVLPPAVDQLEQSGAPGIAPVSLRVIRPIPVPDRPTTPGLALTVGLALLAGIVLGIAIALVRDALDRSLRSAGDLAGAVGLPVLGSLPARQKRLTGPAVESERSELGEAYRQLRTAMQSSATSGTRHATPGVLVVTSPGPGEGRTSAVVNLAVAAAGSGASVLLVDADLRRPRAARMLGIDTGTGLTDLLSGAAGTESVIRTTPQGVDVLASGRLPTNPAELLAGGVLPDLFEELGERYALVLVDVPPVLPVTDAVVVAAAADGAVILARRGTTSRDDAAAAVRALETGGAHPLGTVLVADPDHRAALAEAGESRTPIVPRRPSPRPAVREVPRNVAAFPVPARTVVEPPPVPEAHAAAPAVDHVGSAPERPGPGGPAPDRAGRAHPAAERRAPDLPAPLRPAPARREQAAPRPATATNAPGSARLSGADPSERTEAVPRSPQPHPPATSSPGRPDGTGAASPGRQSAAGTALPEPRSAPSGPSRTSARHRQPDAGSARDGRGGDSLLDFGRSADGRPDSARNSGADRDRNGRNDQHRDTDPRAAARPGSPDRRA